MDVPLQLRVGLTNHALSYDLTVAVTSCATVDSPTVRDLVNDVGPDHDDLCGCGIQVGTRVWIAQSVRGASTEGIDTSLLPACRLDAKLDQLSYLVDENPRVCHLLIEGEGTAVQEEKPVEPVVIREFYAAAFYDGRSTELHLPVEAETDYAAACAVEGNLLVDKSGYIHVGRASSFDGWLPTIRRPAGYGKTMFLSLVEHYVDVNSEGSPTPFPSAHFRHIRGFERILPRRALLVLHLDLSELPAQLAATEIALCTLCRDFLDSCAATCYQRYLNWFSGDKSPLVGQFTFSTLMKFANDDDIKLFVGVDNYTSPFAAPLPANTIEALLVDEIFTPIFNGYDSGVISSGLMVGRELPDLQWPCRTHISFAVASAELSHVPIAFNILGMDDYEIQVVGRALFGADAGERFLRRVRAAASLPPSRLDIPAHYGGSYCTRDVLALARILQQSWSADAANAARVALVDEDDYPHPVHSVALGLDDAPVESDKEFMAVMHDAIAAEIARRPVPATPGRPRKSDAASDDGSVSSRNTRSSASWPSADSPPSLLPARSVHSTKSPSPSSLPK